MSAFFILSKIGWMVIEPGNLIALFLVLFVLGAALEWHRMAAFALRAGVGLFLVLGVLPVGPNALHYLEIRYDKPVSLPHIDGILVLGGAVDARASIASGRPEFNDAVDRVDAAIEMARYFPKAKLVFSGGSGALVGSHRIDSIDMKVFLKNMGYDSFNVIYEDKSKNTYQNIVNSYRMVKPKKGERWILITSAYHMNRAMAVARKIGWGLIPYPVDYRAGPRYGWWPAGISVLGNLQDARIVMREMVGLAAYRLTGKI